MKAPRLAITVVLSAVVIAAFSAGLPHRARAASPQAEEAPQTSEPPLRLVWRDAERTSGVDLVVTVAGRSPVACWNDVFAELLRFFDRNGDHRLDAAEAGRLPTAFALRQSLWGNFSLATGSSPPLQDVDLDADGFVSAAELAGFYRARGLGELQVASASVTVAPCCTPRSSLGSTIIKTVSCKPAN
ncbi:MAG: hypothetical protein QM775_11775 [Pirellulales bacterium]